MKVINIHKRIIHQDLPQVAALVNTLASKDDKVWPYEKWPRMKLDKGLQVDSKGGHGPIRYFINAYKAGEMIQFQFTAPKGFYGVHRFEMKSMTEGKTEIKHTIDLNAKGLAIIKWSLIIRWLHDALIEDAFDKIENNFDQGNRRTNWSFWVKLWRRLLK